MFNSFWNIFEIYAFTLGTTSIHIDIKHEETFDLRRPLRKVFDFTQKNCIYFEDIISEITAFYLEHVFY